MFWELEKKIVLTPVKVLKFYIDRTHRNFLLYRSPEFSGKSKNIKNIADSLFFLLRLNRSLKAISYELLKVFAMEADQCVKVLHN